MAASHPKLCPRRLMVRVATFTVPHERRTNDEASCVVTDQSGVGSVGSVSSSRQRFSADELAIVLSHFNVGAIESIKEFRRRSRKAPKLMLRADQGTYLLKRRARERDDSAKVSFCHALQLYLSERGFSLPRLIRTKKDCSTMLQWENVIYELFEYIKGESYDNSLEVTTESGRTLAQFHNFLADYQPDQEAPQGSYHASRSVAASMQQISGAMAGLDPANAEHEKDQIQRLVQFLHRSYEDAVDCVNHIGLGTWPMQIVHSDWHPSNMLFREMRVVAVIDYDSARYHQRIRTWPTAPWNSPSSGAETTRPSDLITSMSLGTSTSSVDTTAPPTGGSAGPRSGHCRGSWLRR